jgi:hypothetical protein
MRSLVVAAAAVVAAVLHGTVPDRAGAPPHIETVYTHSGSIAAFAQDGPLVAWFAPAQKSCNTLHVLSLVNPLHETLPDEGGAQNVTCVWKVGANPVRIALAGNRLAWTLRQQMPIPFDYLLGASAAPGGGKERRFQQFAHTKRGVGLWLNGLSGDGDTLVYGIAAVDYVDEAGCLAGTGTCALKTTGGGVYRMIGRQTPQLIPGTDTAGAVMVSASQGAVAFVPSAGVAKNGMPMAGDRYDLPIEIVDALTGTVISKVTPQGVPLAISLTPSYLVTLERTDSGLRIAWYDRVTGTPEGSVPAPAGTSPTIAADDQSVIYRVARSIRSVDIATEKSRELTRAAAMPIGLSIEGRRVAWAENLGGTTRIRALYLTP